MVDLIQYATIEQLGSYGLPAALVATIDGYVADDHLQAATRMVRSRLLVVYTAPITAVGLDIAQITCQIAAFSLLANVIGFDPGTTYHQAIVDAKDNALSWLDRVAKGQAIADVTDTPATTGEVGGVVIATDTLRGWGDELI
jgi:phage gp36-like protein